MEACCNVDPIAVDVITINDDVADIDADPVGDLTIFGNAGISLHHSALNIDGEKHGIDDTAELHQCAITHKLDDPAPVFGGLRPDQFFAVGFELRKSA